MSVDRWPLAVIYENVTLCVHHGHRPTVNGPQVNGPPEFLITDRQIFITLFPDLRKSVKSEFCVDFSKRSYTKELLDRDDIPFADIRRNMKELEFINAHLGGHSITIDGLKNLLTDRRKEERTMIIGEIGCGGGDNLLAIHLWCRRRQIPAKLIGIDINPHCIEVAKDKLSGTNSRFICADYQLAGFADERPDFLFSSLFCHHFAEEELVSMLRWMQQNAASGFFINDLHRHRLAYYSIKLLSSLFSRSYLVKNDAPLSVLRGFKRKEWVMMLEKAGITVYSLEWKWAFRHLLTVHTDVPGNH